MNATPGRRHDGLLALALLTALWLTAVSAVPPARAGGLMDFFKKGNEASQSDRNSSSSEGRHSSERERDSSDSGSLLDLFRKKPERHDPEPSEKPSARPSPPSRPAPSTSGDRQGGLLDIFRKESGTRPSPRPAPRPTYGIPRPPSASPGSGGLLDLFRKPGRPPSPPVVVPRPPVVIYHYYDPWYYPYDRVFFTYYCPWVIREREVWIESEPYIYYRPSPSHYERTAREALEDIERGWQRGDYSLIARYVDPNRTIRIYHDGEYSHSMTAREFRALTCQSFEDIRTLRFRFYNPTIGPHEVRADAEHVFIGPDGEERRVEMTYTLQRWRDRWFIYSIDLREQRRLASYMEQDPTAEGPTFSLVRYQAEVVPVAESVPVWTLQAAGDWALREPPVPDLVRPRLVLLPPAMSVLHQDAPPFLLVAEARPARTISPTVIATRPWRVICTSHPVALSTLRSAKRPLSGAVLVYMRSDARATYEVRLSLAGESLSWKIFHRGEPRVADGGAVALPAHKANAPHNGAVHVVVDRLSTPVVSGLIPLFERPSWDLRVGLVLLPQVSPSAQPVRTEILIRPPTK